MTKRERMRWQAAWLTHYGRTYPVTAVQFVGKQMDIAITYCASANGPELTTHLPRREARRLAQCINQALDDYRKAR
ncbi:MAG: hypothetical protein IMZ50_16425 [Candidatus Atribacteria bacterium]|nr:hypothetical protein [Candidatus Atribacteria bacterium]